VDNGRLLSRVTEMCRKKNKNLLFLIRLIRSTVLGALAIGPHALSRTFCGRLGQEKIKPSSIIGEDSLRNARGKLTEKKEMGLTNATASRRRQNELRGLRSRMYRLSPLEGDGLLPLRENREHTLRLPGHEKQPMLLAKGDRSEDRERFKRFRK